MTEAMIFDLDGVLIDSERIWDEVRRDLTLAHGGHWPPEAQRTVMGMSSAEWSAYMANDLGVPMAPEKIVEEVADRLSERYARDLPLMDGAVETVTELAHRMRLGVASSSPQHVIEAVLDAAGIAGCFGAVVSSERVRRGKPAPDVFLRAASELVIPPVLCWAVEDSSNGLRAAHAAGMRVIAIPNRDYPPHPEALRLADTVLSSLPQLVSSTLASGSR